MNLLPYDSFTITTSYSAPQVARVLQDHIEPPRVRWFGWGRDHKEFQGVVKETEFTLTRVINYRNSFLPVIYGRIEQGLGDTRVVARMNPHPVVIVIMLIWFGFFGQVCLLALRGVLPFESADLASLAIPLGFVMFGYLMMWGGFWFEARKARRILVELLSYPTAQPPPTGQE